MNTSKILIFVLSVILLIVVIKYMRGISVREGFEMEYLGIYDDYDGDINTYNKHYKAALKLLYNCDTPEDCSGYASQAGNGDEWRSTRGDLLKINLANYTLMIKQIAANFAKLKITIDGILTKDNANPQVAVNTGTIAANTDAIAANTGAIATNKINIGNIGRVEDKDKDINERIRSMVRNGLSSDKNTNGFASNLAHRNYNYIKTKMPQEWVTLNDENINRHTGTAEIIKRQKITSDRLKNIVTYFKDVKTQQDIINQIKKDVGVATRVPKTWLEVTGDLGETTSKRLKNIVTYFKDGDKISKTITDTAETEAIKATAEETKATAEEAKTTAEEAKTTADAAATKSALSQLSLEVKALEDKVTELEGKKSASSDHTHSSDKIDEIDVWTENHKVHHDAQKTEYESHINAFQTLQDSALNKSEFNNHLTQYVGHIKNFQTLQASTEDIDKNLKDWQTSFNKAKGELNVNIKCQEDGTGKWGEEPGQYCPEWLKPKD
jgi:hypothetical protein